MNIVSSCQGKNLKIFLKLVDLIKSSRAVKDIGVFVSDSMSFDKEKSSRRSNIKILKEWEIFDKARNTRLDLKVLKEYEKKIGDPILFWALLADRRIFFGKKCKAQQDYTPRFSYEQMMSILQVSLKSIDQFFKEIQPNLVVSFGISNLGDYLFYLFAKANNVPFLQLKATKISNRVSFNDDAIELSFHIKQSYYDGEFDNDTVNEAELYMQKVENSGVKYEGAILQKRGINFRHIILALLKGSSASLRRRLNFIYRNDNHLEPYFLLQLRHELINPIKYKYIEFKLKSKTISSKDLQQHNNFVFFPLHFEPEVSMQVFGKGYQNQIELIRIIALSLPIGMELLVKEHPRSKGFRKLSYYQKILNIPNVRFIKSEIPTNMVVKYSKMVATISGSTGFEAAIIGRPVIVFGNPIYNILPDNMVRYISDINNLDSEIKDLLEKYKQNRTALINYLSATIQGSVPVDLYTTLLGKSGRYGSINGDVEQQYVLLADYLNKRIDDVSIR